LSRHESVTPTPKTRRGTQLNQAALTIQLLLNGVTGYLFVRLLASLYGTTAQKDAFDIAYSVPFFLVNVGGLAFLHGLVTVRFSQMLEASSPDMSEVYSSLMSWTVLVSCVLTVATVYAARPIMLVLAPGLPDEYLLLGARYLQILAPLAATYSVSALASAVLIAIERPVAVELSQIASRLVVLGAADGLNSRLSMESISVLLLLGSVGAAVAQVAIIHRVARLRFSWSLDTGFLRDAGDLRTRGAWMIAAALSSQVATAYLRRLATTDGIGTTAAIGYSLALVGPIGVLIGKPFALALGPGIVRDMAGGQALSGRHRIRAATLGALACGLGISILISVFSATLTTVALKSGQFDAGSVEITRQLLTIVAWSLPSAIVLWVLFMPMLADASPSSAGMVYVAGYTVQLVLYWALFNMIGRHGLAWAYVAGVSIQALAGAWILRHQFVTTRSPLTRPQERLAGSRPFTPTAMATWISAASELYMIARWLLLKLAALGLFAFRPSQASRLTIAAGNRLFRRTYAPELFDSADSYVRGMPVNLVAYRDLLGPPPAARETVLDLGSGLGQYSIALAEEEDRRLIAVEIQQEKNMWATRALPHPNVCRVTADSANLPIRGQTIDLIFSHTVFEHLPDVRGTLLEMKRILRWQGRAVLSVNFLCNRGGHHLFPYIHFPWATWLVPERDLCGYWTDRLRHDQREGRLRFFEDGLSLHSLGEGAEIHLNRISPAEFETLIAEAGFLIERRHGGDTLGRFLPTHLIPKQLRPFIEGTIYYLLRPGANQSLCVE
jgi:putative peptidoglycan lipid II flippase